MNMVDKSDAFKNSPFCDYWYPVCQSHQLKDKPLGRTLFQIPLVIFRDKVTHKPLAFFDLCPHRNAPLSAGRITEEGLLECPYHGWRFNMQGNCVDIPGYPNFCQKEKISPLNHYHVIEQQGLVWVYARQTTDFPEITPYTLPEYETPGVINGCNEIVIRSNYREVLDNFLDSMHPHFVHRGLMYDDKKRQLLTVNVHRLFRLKTGDKIIGLEAIFMNERVNMGSAIFNMIAPKDPVTHYERYFIPIIHQAEYSYKDKIRFIVTFIMSPISETETRVFSKYTVKTKLANFIVRPLVKHVLLKILHQDDGILTLQTDAMEKAQMRKFIYTEVDLLPLHTKRFLNCIQHNMPLEELDYEDKQYDVLL